VANFKFENGRRYHSYREGSYYMPNDEQEQERLDMQHHIYRMALDDKLFLAPVTKEQLLDVLDVGCGTGMWCIDVADENPQAQVLGIDLRCVCGTAFFDDESNV
jgi:tRNA G46 methylase TrmB